MNWKKFELKKNQFEAKSIKTKKFWKNINRKLNEFETKRSTKGMNYKRNEFRIK